MDKSKEIRFVLQITVKNMETFRGAVERAVEISNAEPGTLIYDWYIDEDESTARLYEAYESIEAVTAHAGGAVFTEIGPIFMESCSFDHMDAFGDVGRLADGPGFWPSKFWGRPYAGLNR
jgi:quinol monooxygenase YgiN